MIFGIVFTNGCKFSVNKQDIKKCVQKGLKKCYYSIYMNIVTPPKKDLKTRHYSKDMNMDNNVATLPKKGLKTRPYNIVMGKKGLKKYDYTMYMDMEKEYLKKLTKGQLIKLVLKQKKSKMVSNHEDLLNNNPFKDEVAQEPAKPRTDRPLQMQNARRPPKPTRKPPPPPIPQVEDHIINVPVPKIKELNRALKVQIKCFFLIPEFERAAKIRKIAVYRFLISFLVSEL